MRKTFPHFFQTNEIIGGYSSYFEFLAHVLEIKEKFVIWYLQKKFFERSKSIEPFAKGNEYVFEMKPVIPKYFLRSLMVSALIACGLLFWTNFYLRKIFKIKNTQAGFEKNPGFYFKLIEPEIEREHILNNYFGTGIVCIDNIEQPDFDRNINLNSFLNWLIYLRGANPTEVDENLKRLGLNKETNQRISDDDIKRVFLAVLLSTGNKFLINNSAKHMSNKFENQFLDVLSELCKKKKTILYLSSEQLEARQKKAFFDNRQNQDFALVDINKISLR